MKLPLLLLLTCLSACGWFGSRKHELPDPAEIIVNGTPAGATVFIDSVPIGQATGADDHPLIIRLAPGNHKVEVHVGNRVVYREDTYVGRGEHRVVDVLSGLRG